jgi:uncharacterized membrane protein
MKHKRTKRLAAAAAVAVLALGAVVIPTSSAQADTGWGGGIAGDSHKAPKPLK